MSDSIHQQAQPVNDTQDDALDVRGEAAVARSAGADMIAAERLRQVEDEGWDAKHDDATDGALVDAAVVYALGAEDGERATLTPRWPWEARWFKPAPPVRMLVKAGALIAAEIDRRLRGEATK